MMRKTLLVSVGVAALLSGVTASQARMPHARTVFDTETVSLGTSFAPRKQMLESMETTSSQSSLKLVSESSESDEDSITSEPSAALSDAAREELDKEFLLITERKVDQSQLIRDAAVAAAAAYNDERQVALHGRTPLRDQEGYAMREQLLAEGHDVVNFYATINGKHVPAGSLAYKDGRVTVFYHGSECVEDFTEANLRYFRVRGEELGINGKVHRGFYNRYMLSRVAMHEALQDLLERHGLSTQDVEVLVTGHSLGAALATLAAADIKNLYGMTDLDLVTFASPRVVNSSGAKSMEDAIGKDRMLRIWRKGDIVPAAVLGLFGWMYKHVGQSLMFDSKTWLSMPSLVNHKHEYNVDEACSEKEYNPYLKHMGVGDVVGATAMAVVSAPVIAGKAVVYGVGTGVDYTAAATKYAGNKVVSTVKKAASKVASAAKSVAKAIASPFKKIGSWFSRSKVAAA